MTLVFTDLVGSTRLKDELGNAEALRLIQEHHALVRALLVEYPDGMEVSTAGDSFFLAFRRPSEAVAFALRLQARSRRWNRRNRRKVLDRVGIHAGEVTVEEGPGGRIHDLHGLDVDKCARVMSLGREHHVLITRFAFDSARAALKGRSFPDVGEVQWVSHGLYELKGVTEPLEICEVAEAGRTSLEPPPDSEKARRVPAEVGTETNRETAPGWRGWLAGGRIDPRLAVWGAVVGALAGWVALLTPMGSALVDASYDASFFLRRTTTPKEAVIVRMDRPSHEELGQPWMGPWDRRIHAALIDRMREYGAKAVVFDVLFDRPAADPAEDAALLAAVRRSGRAVFAGVVDFDFREGLLISRHNQGPFPELAAAAPWGLVDRGGLVDLAVRRPFPGHAGKDSLAAEVVRLAGGDPSRRGGNAWMNFYGPPGTFEAFSYSQVAGDLVPAEVFRDRLVFVGAVYDLGYTGGRGTDDFRTPHSRWTGRRAPGVEVVATSTVNLLRGDWWRRLPPWLELLAVTVLGAGAGYGSCRLRPVAALGSAAAAGVGLAGLNLALADPLRVWFPWLVVVAWVLPVTTAWSVVAWAGAAVRGRGSLRPVSHPTAVGTGSTGMSVARRSPRGGSAGGGRWAIPDYELLREIGRGAYGRVWLARDAIGLWRAVKVVERSAFREARPYEREFDGIKRFTPISLEHEGLVRVLHVGRDDAEGFFYYVMEVADDEERVQDIDPDSYQPRTLAGELKKSGHLAADGVVRLGCEIGSALGFMHGRRLIHRDIKPANILYVRGRSKLADIGLVAEMADAGQPVTLLGTEGFIAPEGPGTAAADVYSLGKLLYVAATGRGAREYPLLPEDWDSRPDRSRREALKDVWERACEVDPGRRSGSAGELVRLLEKI